jgi:hypothetical protein
MALEEIFTHKNEKFRNLFFETLFLKSKDQICFFFKDLVIGKKFLKHP